MTETNNAHPPTYWFGYRYKPSGDYQVKRYNEPLDIQEVSECVGDTVYWVAPAPFIALSRDHAINILHAIDYHEMLSFKCGVEPEEWTKIRDQQETYEMLVGVLNGKKN